MKFTYAQGYRFSSSGKVDEKVMLEVLFLTLTAHDFCRYMEPAKTGDYLQQIPS